MRPILRASGSVLLAFSLASSFACATTSEKSAASPAPVPGTQTPPKAVDAADLVDHTGDSVATAVTVPADAPEEGVPFENDWIYDRYGRFRKKSGGTGQTQGRRYDVITVELPDGSEKTIYFDITDAWNRSLALQR
jgi:hypothetical protein